MNQECDRAIRGERGFRGSVKRKFRRLNRLLAAFEKRLILSALGKNRWNVRQTAFYLGIQRATLYLKMEKFGITRQRYCRRWGERAFEPVAVVGERSEERNIA